MEGEKNKSQPLQRTVPSFLYSNQISLGSVGHEISWVLFRFTLNYLVQPLFRRVPDVPVSFPLSSWRMVRFKWVFYLLVFNTVSTHANDFNEDRYPPNLDYLLEILDFRLKSYD